MDQITIQQASLKDVALLQEIGRETFFETFAESNTPENMAQYLEANFTEEKVSAELNNPDSLFFIARTTNGKTAGYLKVNFGKAQTELQEGNTLEIERIYVKKEYLGKKVGQLLYDKALEIAGQQNRSAIWLGVWEENPRAIRFYEKNGFVAFSRHIFKMGDDEQTDIMMRKVL